MPPEKDAWLFARGDQSILVTKLPMGMTLLVRGPGYAEQSHHFNSAGALDEFWRWYKRHLLADEWILQPTADRRSGRDRAGGAERRRAPRPEVDEAAKSPVS